MKTVIFWFGAMIATLFVLGSFNIGNFVLYYGPDKMSCVKE
jgi:hypothetical protein